MIPIKRATIIDAKEISEVEMDSGYHKKQFDCSSMIQEILKDEKTSVFVAKAKNIFGYISLRKCHKTGEIGFLAVCKEAQRKGIGSALIKFILRYAKRIGCKSVSLEVRKNNFKAKSLYNRFGFQVVGVKKKKSKERTITKLIMKKEL